MLDLPPVETIVLDSYTGSLQCCSHGGFGRVDVKHAEKLPERLLGSLLEDTDALGDEDISTASP
jgi:hypothetical protein